jgi:hypothetical protein
MIAVDWIMVRYLVVLVVLIVAVPSIIAALLAPTPSWPLKLLAIAAALFLALGPGA